jgi:pentatricopeptide repeat protein
MGKTLKRQRAKAAAAAAASAPHHPQQQKRHKGAIAAAPTTPPAPTTASAWTSAVSSALERRRWDEACRLLDGMRRAGKAPKLGAIQRWVRDADAAGDEAVAARVICGVLRSAEVAVEGGASAVPPSKQQQQQEEEEAAAVDAAAAAVIRHAPWSPPPNPTAPAAGAAAAGPATPNAPTSTPPPPKFHRIPRAPGAGGADSFVAGAAPVPICAFAPGSAVRWDGEDDGHPPPAVTRADVPFVPGAFVLVGALSARECGEVLRAGRSLGFSREVDYAFGGGAAAAAAAPAVEAAAPTTDPLSSSAARRVAAAAAGLEAASGRPAEGCVWLADDTVLDPLWRRVRHLLPQELGGGPLVGINSRWRLYRYTPGAVFRPHVDGAWPSSGLDDKGRYLFDARGGEVWSRLTFLIYLNGADEEEGEEEGARFEEEGGEEERHDNGGTFQGGATTFFSPALDGSARLHARGVKPRRGNVLVFPHGDTAGALVHEGSAVTRGAKYVVRTEVLYALPPKDPVSGRRQRPPPEAAAGLGLRLPAGGGGGGAAS